MNDADPAKLSQADRGLLESWLLEFDWTWNDRALANRVRRLSELPERLRLPALVEMVKIDLERQWQRGRKLPIESYLMRFPELGSPAYASARLIHAEYEVRRQFGDPAELSEFARRFPRQAIELRQLAEQRAAATHEQSECDTSGLALGTRNERPAPAIAEHPRISRQQ